MNHIKTYALIFGIFGLAFSASARSAHILIDESPGSNSGKNLYAYAEGAFQEEVKAQCGITSGGVPIHDVEIKIRGCGALRLDPPPGTDVTRLACYPSVIVTGNVECPN